MQQNVEVKKSGISGKGVFTLKDLDINDFILKIEGQKIYIKDPHELDDYTLDHSFPIRKFGDTFEFIIQSEPSKYLNHSCEPNAGIRNNVEIIAFRPIKKGEEIFIDYAMCNIDDFVMECKCNSQSCRDKVVPFDQLDKNTQNDYLPYVIDYVKEKYIKKNKI